MFICMKIIYSLSKVDSLSIEDAHLYTEICRVGVNRHVYLYEDAYPHTVQINMPFYMKKSALDVGKICNFSSCFFANCWSTSLLHSWIFDKKVINFTFVNFHENGRKSGCLREDVCESCFYTHEILLSLEFFLKVLIFMIFFARIA